MSCGKCVGRWVGGERTNDQIIHEPTNNVMRAFYSASQRGM